MFRRFAGTIIKTALMRIPILAALVLLAPAFPAGAQAPETPAPSEVLLTLVCPVSPCRFRLGEVIHLKLSVTATEAGYGVEAFDGLRERDLELFTAAPSDGVSDPLEGIMVAMNPSSFRSQPEAPGLSRGRLACKSISCPILWI